MFARILIEVDFSQELVYELTVENGGISYDVEVVYENLPEFCTHCGIVGHTISACRAARRQAESILPSSHGKESSRQDSRPRSRSRGRGQSRAPKDKGPVAPQQQVYRPIIRSAAQTSFIETGSSSGLVSAPPLPHSTGLSMGISSGLVIPPCTDAVFPPAVTSSGLVPRSTQTHSPRVSHSPGSVQTPVLAQSPVISSGLVQLSAVTPSALVPSSATAHSPRVSHSPGSVRTPVLVQSPVIDLSLNRWAPLQDMIGPATDTRLAVLSESSEDDGSCSEVEALGFGSDMDTVHDDGEYVEESVSPPGDPLPIIPVSGPEQCMLLRQPSLSSSLADQDSPIRTDTVSAVVPDSQRQDVVLYSPSQATGSSGKATDTASPTPDGFTPVVTKKTRQRLSKEQRQAEISLAKNKGAARAQAPVVTRAHSRGNPKSGSQ